MNWNVKEIDATELAQLADTAQPYRLIDVREIAEIKAGTIDGAEPIPMATIPLRANELSKDEKLIVMCRTGARSAQVCAFLQQQHGFENVYNLRGGIFAWASSGMPVTLPRAV